ncbi:MAG: hypothetical protein MZV65_28530 [Chromatiales bacterium]|nr:hypothetical protein [Chromatiales bacterium]
MAKITKREFAETADLYLLDFVIIDEERNGRWSWRYCLEMIERAVEQPDTRTFKTRREAIDAAIDWLKSHDNHVAGIAKHHANEWMRYNGHTFY